MEKGFRFIVVEGDCPDCYKINPYVKGYKDAGDSITEILKNFDRLVAEKVNKELSAGTEAQ